MKQLYGQKQGRWVEVFLKIFPGWSIVIILIGLSSIFSREMRCPLSYVVFIMATSVPIIIFTAAQFDVRYLAWLIPLILYFFYLGVYKVINHFSQVLNIVTPLIFLGLLIIFPGFSVNYLYNPIKFAGDFSNTYNKNELREVGLWIKNNASQSNPKIMMRHEGAEFYSEGEIIYLPQISYEKLIEYAKVNKVNYLVAWDEDLAYDDKLSGLLESKSENPGLEEVYMVGDKSNPKVVVYKLTEN